MPSYGLYFDPITNLTYTLIYFISMTITQLPLRLFPKSHQMFSFVNCIGVYNLLLL